MTLRGDCSTCKQFEADWGYNRCRLGYFRFAHDSESPLAANHHDLMKVVWKLAAKGCPKYEVRKEDGSN